MTENSTAAPGQLIGDLQFRDYVRIIERRRLPILLTVLAVTIMVGIVALRLPNVYRCETIILVDPQKVPENYVRSTVTTSIADRLANISQQVMAPARLKRLIDTMGLYPNLRKTVGEQELISDMQKSINVEVVNTLGAQLNAFRIAFRSKNAVEAAQVTNQLAAMFIEENLKAREQQSYGTSDFLESELKKTSQQLEKKDGELSDLRSRYIQDLPESQQFHIQALESLRLQLRNSQERISRAQQEKVYLQSVMSATAPTVDVDLGVGASPLQSEIRELQGKMSTLEGRYGPTHPDVRKLQAQINELNAKQAQSGMDRDAATAAATAAAKSSKLHNPVIEAQLDRLDQEIEEQRRLQAPIQNQINFHTAKMEQVPVFQQKTAGLTRVYDTLKSRYTQLLDKKLAADTASNLETRQESERFVILEPGQVPEKPYAPNRILIIVGGFFVGLLAAAGIAGAIEVADNSVRDETDVERILSKPVLTTVPEILTVGQALGQWARLYGVTAVTVVLAVAIGFEASQLADRFF